MQPKIDTKQILKSLKDQTITITGTFSFDLIVKSFGHPKRRLLFLDITDQEGNIIADHLCVDSTKGFEAQQLRQGDKLKFEGKVTKYTRFPDEGDDRPIQTDYKLTYPKNITKI